MSIDPKDYQIDTELRDLYSAKEYDRCLDACKDTLTKNPLDLQALLYSVNISFNQENYKDCIHYSDTIIRGVDDSLPFVWSQRGLAQTLLRQYKEAEVSYNKSIEYDPANIETWSFFALAVYMQDEKEEALGLLDFVEGKLQCYGAFALVRGLIERTEGNNDEAFIHFLEGGMAVDPTSSDYEERKEFFAKLTKETLEE